MNHLFQLKSLQARLLALLLAMAALVWLGAAALTWQDAQHELDELLDGHLAQSAALLIVQQADHGGDHSNSDDKIHPGDHVDDAPSLHKYAPRVAFQVFHEDKLTMSSANAGSVPMSTLIRGFSTVLLQDRSEWRVFATQGNEGDVQVFVGEQTNARDDILWAVIRGLLMPLVYAFPLLGLLVWWAVRNGLAPLRHLSGVLAERQPKALEPVVLNNMPSEMAPVVQSLNALFERIEAMVTAERRFTSDAAHELRTPIAAIRTQAQVALGAGSDTASREHALQYTLAGCDRATHLVEQLLTLSRLEASTMAAPVARIDLSALVRRVAADLAPTALGHHQELELQASAPCPIQADDMLTSVLVRNLLDNAMRYSPDGARIDLSVYQQESYVTLQVQDSGHGLSDEEMSHLGERFYRVLGTTQTGSGLGWSIVRRIAAVYQAQVQVSRSEELGGLRVTVRWIAAGP